MNQKKKRKTVAYHAKPQSQDAIFINALRIVMGLAPFGAEQPSPPEIYPDVSCENVYVPGGRMTSRKRSKI